LTGGLYKYCRNTLKYKVKKDLFYAQIIYNKCARLPEKLLNLENANNEVKGINKLIDPTYE
jgi:hypothetical protein